MERALLAQQRSRTISILRDLAHEERDCADSMVCKHGRALALIEAANVLENVLAATSTGSKGH